MIFWVIIYRHSETGEVIRVLKTEMSEATAVVAELLLPVTKWELVHALEINPTRGSAEEVRIGIDKWTGRLQLVKYHQTIFE